MKHKIVSLFVFLFIFIFTQEKNYSAQYGYVPEKSMEVTPDASEYSDVDIPVIEYNTGDDAKDPRTLNEKMRSKLHLPPTRKIYYHHIDKSNQPITEAQYYKLSEEKKRKDFEIPEPQFDDDSKLITPEHQFRVIRYNTPPGKRNIDVGRLVSQRSVSSPGILSPDNKKFVYTKSYFYPEFSQTASSVYFIPVSSKLSDAYEILYNTNIVQGSISPLFTVGAEELIRYRFKTLFPLDWSKDSSKIAFKEKIGSNADETWQTNIIVYNFETKSWKRLTAVREAVIYYWRNKNIDLKDYLWDIFPVGWDKNNPDAIIVYAYAFTDEKPLFLGTWSIDAEENKTTLISPSSTNVMIDLNGFGLKEIKNEH